MKTEADLEALVRGVVSAVVGSGVVAPGAALSTADAQAKNPAPPLAAAAEARTGPGLMHVAPTGRNGIFATIDDAVSAAESSQRTFAAQPLERRKLYLAAMRAAGVANAERLARSAFEETGLGRFRDKVEKNVFAAQRSAGVEDLAANAFAGDFGFAIEDWLPWGVVASITPINSPSAFIVNHGITMLAGGNAVVFNNHPGCWNTSMATVELLNRAVVEAGGPDNLMTGVVEPSLDTAKALVVHPDVDMLVITGGAALIKDAFATRKRVIAAGPGNPTAVVDESADPRRAAREIFKGCSFENTILCIGEKTCVVTEAAASDLLGAFDELPVRRLDAREAELVFQTVIDTGGHHPVTRREFVGKDAELLLEAAGLSAPKPVGMLLAEVDRDHPLVRMEQFLPLLPLVRARDANDMIELGLEVEGRNHHTVMIHSNRPATVERFAREADCVVCVVNGSSLRGLGVEGEGYPGFTIETVTGEGITAPRHYVRARRVSHTR